MDMCEAERNEITLTAVKALDESHLNDAHRCITRWH